MSNLMQPWDMSRRGHRAFDVCGERDISMNQGAVTVRATGFACADDEHVRKQYLDFNDPGNETWINSAKFTLCFTKKCTIIAPITNCRICFGN